VIICRSHRQIIPPRPPQPPAFPPAPADPGEHGSHPATSGGRAAADIAEAERSDQRISQLSYQDAILIGATQILALLAGISRSGVTMAGGLAAYLPVRFLVRWFQTRTLIPFAIYCLAFGLLSILRFL
jgi:undecaprenyl pyrophosphate phosphatase UppP